MSETPLDHFLGAKPSSPSRRAFSVGLLVVASIAAVALLVRFLVGSDVPYYTAPAARDDFTPVFNARGEIRGQQEVTIAAPQDGVVGTVVARGEGWVRQGQPLASFATAPLEQAVLADQAALDQAQTALDTADISATEMASRLRRYEYVWRRSDQRVPSLNEMAGARADAGKAELALDAARSVRDEAMRQLAASQARRAGAIVLSPAAGYITAGLIQPGQYVRLDQPLFTLAVGAGGLQVTVPIDAGDARSLAAGARARVSIDGFADDRVRQATLSAILPPAAGSARRQAVFRLDQPENEARPGMLATIAIELPKRENALLVPNAALAFDPKTKTPGSCGCVYVLSRQGTPRRVNIVAGASDGSRTEILSGDLAPGDKVIIGWRNGAAARQQD